MVSTLKFFMGEGGLSIWYHALIIHSSHPYCTLHQICSTLVFWGRMQSFWKHHNPNMLSYHLKSKVYIFKGLAHADTIFFWRFSAISFSLLMCSCCFLWGLFDTCFDSPNIAPCYWNKNLQGNMPNITWCNTESTTRGCKTRALWKK